ncbi:MAG: OmpA family protein [Bacteroidetes bacterium]|nr:OmpA family protein [Bacteroidota bacterium]
MKNIKPLLLLFTLVLSFQLFGQQGVELKNIKEINGSQLDFSPIPYKNGVIFTTSKSNRFLQCPPEKPDDYTDLKFSEKKDDGSFTKPVSLSGKVNGKYNDGNAAFNPTGDKMIFTRNNLEGKNAQGIIDLKLYSADLEGDKWTNVTELPFNSDDWSTCHPALSKDGTLLVFSSNPPGSTENSMDLYWAKWENGVWSIPTNLGLGVNTNANELFPFLDENNTLFFSSDRPGGSGGLDIWVAEMDASGQWQMVGNLGAPFNQSGDDVSFVSLNGGTEGYIASDRGHQDAKGKDDIYLWKYDPQPRDVIIAVEDKETKERLVGATVDITPVEYGNMLDKIYSGPKVAKNEVLTTDKNGLVTYSVRKGNKYAIVTNKAEYKPDKREVMAEQFPESPTPYIIPLEREICLVKMVIEVVEDPSGNKISLADITVTDKKTGKVINLKSDANGEAFIAQVECDHDYEITGKKENYYPNTVRITNPKGKFKHGEEVRVKVPLKPLQVVMLEPIFFDFDKYYIRKRDAQPTLDNLADIMNQYPSLVVRLGGNTDSRGTNKYNERLGVNRARSAKDYLVRKKKVNKDRILTEAFGETRPVNNCTDEVYCPETDHQLNRRVDVTAERHNEQGVVFKTRPVSEMHVESDRKDRKK